MQTLYDMFLGQGLVVLVGFCYLGHVVDVVPGGIRVLGQLVDDLGLGDLHDDVLYDGALFLLEDGKCELVWLLLLLGEFWDFLYAVLEGRVLLTFFLFLLVLQLGLQEPFPVPSLPLLDLVLDDFFLFLLLPHQVVLHLQHFLLDDHQFVSQFLVLCFLELVLTLFAKRLLFDVIYLILVTSLIKVIRFEAVHALETAVGLVHFLLAQGSELLRGSGFIGQFNQGRGLLLG